MGCCGSKNADIDRIGCASKYASDAADAASSAAESAKDAKQKVRQARDDWADVIDSDGESGKADPNVIEETILEDTMTVIPDSKTTARKLEVLSEQLVELDAGAEKKVRAINVGRGPLPARLIEWQ